MIDSTREIDFISGKVFRDNKIVTYSEVSKELSVPFSRAKKTVYEFYRANKSKLTASFIITGTKGGIKTVQFALNESIVDYEIEKFDNVTEVHIYGVSPLEFSYTVRDVVLNVLEKKVDYERLGDYYKQGMIQGPELVDAETTAGSDIKPPSALANTKLTTNTTKASPTTEKSTDTEKKTKTFNTGLSSGYVSRKPQKPQQGNDISKFVKGKRPAEEEKPKYQYKSRKLEKKDKVVMSEDHEDHEDDKEEEPGVVEMDAGTKSKLSAMFDDDFSDDEPPKEEPKEEPEIVSEDVETPQAVQDPVEETTDPAEVGKSVEDEKEVAPEYDEDGYFIHKAKPKPKTKGKPATKVVKPTSSKPTTSKPTKSAGKGGNKKQSSLMNFFGKQK
jgi:DNA polymerase delta subunit 3